MASLKFRHYATESALKGTGTVDDALNAFDVGTIVFIDDTQKQYIITSKSNNVVTYKIYYGEAAVVGVSGSGATRTLTFSDGHIIDVKINDVEHAISADTAETAKSVAWNNVSGIPTNFVTTDGTQTITGSKIFTNNVSLQGSTSADSITTEDLIVNGAARFVSGLTGDLKGDVVGNVTGNVTGNVSGSSGSCTGNALTATTLQTARSINGTSFNGSQAITTAKWGTARTITIADNTNEHTQANNNIDGSANFTLKLPSTIKANIIGNASTADSAKSVDWANVTNKPNLVTTDTEQTITGAKIFNNNTTFKNETYVESLTADSLLVTGSARFTNTINGNLKGNVEGNLTGNASTATTAAICTGNSATATALTTNAGSTKIPVYFTEGKPSAISIIAGGADIERPLVVVTDNNELYKTSGITANYSKNSITATTFKGNLEGNALTATTALNCSGNAATATKATTATSLGSGALKYMCSLYATDIYNAYKIVTDWHKSDYLMPTINIRGYAYGSASTIDCDIVIYHYNDTPVSYSITNKGSYPIRVWQAIENDVQVFYINPGEYYGMFHVFVYSGIETNSFTNWSMIPVDEISGTEISSKPIATSITGNAATATTASSCTGNAGTATTLQNTRKINGTDFNGSADITTSKWGTARNITISDGTNSGTATSVDGSGAIILNLPGTIRANLSGNASSATNATNDGSGNTITSTYATKTERSNNDITAASLNATKLTLTRATGNITANIPTWNQDTTGTAAKATADAKGNNIINTYATKAEVAALPKSMVIKGTLDATHALPTSGMTEGDTYIVGASGTYNGIACKVGDFFVRTSDGWLRIPAGDEWEYNENTIKAIKVNNAVHADTAGTASSVAWAGITGIPDLVTTDAEQTITGNKSFKNETSIESLTADSLLVTGPARFTNNIQGNLIGNVTGYLTGNISGSSTSCSGNADNATKDGSGNNIVNTYARIDKVYDDSGSYRQFLGKSGSSSDWVRTTEAGIIPYTNGDASHGHSSLGTSSWYFSEAYIQNIYGYLNGNISGSSTSCSGNSATATKAACLDTGGMTLYAHNSNEINFGGTYASSTIYFGCRATDSKPIPTSFIFGGSTGIATLTAGGFKKSDSSSSYVLTGDGGHAAISGLSVNYAASAGSCSGNSATATKATQDSDGNAINTTYLKRSGGTVTGNVAFNSSVTIDSLTTEDLIVNGSARFVSGLTGDLVGNVTGNLTGTASYATNAGSASSAGTATTSGACTGNAATATKLQTARTIWGQSFDGSGNVRGSLTGVTNITASGVIFSNNYGANGNTAIAAFVFNKGGDYFGIGPSSGGVANVGFGTTTNTTGTWKSEMMTITNSGNVGIGTTSPTSKLHVAGTGYFTGDTSSAANIIAGGYIKGETVKISSGCTLQYDSTQKCIRFVFS